MIPIHIRTTLNPRSRAARAVIKASLVLVVLLAVIYPSPRLLIRNIRHWRNLDALIDPTSPALDPLAAELGPQLIGIAPGPEALEIVQNYVVRKIPYAWDWDTWGVLDYVPTVEETLAKGREDCDGRAVVAASLLRRLGYEAVLMSDLSHVWVWTPEGQTMAPVQTSSGLAVIGPGQAGGSRIDWRAVFAAATLAKDLPTSVAYGIAVFPAWRETLVMIAAGLVLVGRHPRLRDEIIGLAALVAGWWVIRMTCSDPWDRSVIGAWAGYGLVATGLVTMVRASAAARLGPAEAAVAPVR